MEEIGSGLNPRMLVNSIMDANFETGPEEWAEIVAIEKKLEHYRILAQNEEGRYLSPLLYDISNALEKSSADDAFAHVKAVLSRLAADLRIVRGEIKATEVPESYATFREFVAQLYRILDVFDEGISRIAALLGGQDRTLIEEAIRTMETSANAHAALLKDERESGPSEAAPTVFTYSRGGKPGGKIITSPLLERLQGALTGLGAGTLGDDEFAATVKEVQGTIEHFVALCTSDILPSKDEDPEGYTSFRDVWAGLQKADEYAREGACLLLSWLEEKDEGKLHQGYDVFQKGIQEFVAVYSQLDLMKRSGI
ncbi:MAG: hypothetical protein RDV48_14230 [Candidatus Eremiobacteraeota bacterium]|nr:hypothetical protein [Candidatus Eremiobacteraeota bacterium]